MFASKRLLYVQVELSSCCFIFTQNGFFPVKTQIKVYAAFTPVTASMAEELASLGAQAITEEDAPWTWVEGDTLRISFEGVYFPVEDVVEALEANLPPACNGKLDVLLLDDWELHRYVWQGGAFVLGKRSLNHVLSYSGL